VVPVDELASADRRDRDAHPLRAGGGRLFEEAGGDRSGRSSATSGCPIVGFRMARRSERPAGAGLDDRGSSQAVVSSRGPGRLLAHGSGSAGHVRELSFSDVLVKAAPAFLVTRER
jgi:hypothetical protein